MAHYHNSTEYTEDMPQPTWYDEVDPADFEVLDEVGDCPQCGGCPTVLGTLGRLEWVRCRNCGWEWSLPKDL